MEDNSNDCFKNLFLLLICYCLQTDKRVGLFRPASIIYIQHFWQFKATEFYVFISCVLTYSIQQSLSREANSSSATQGIPRILRNPKIHYRIYVGRSSSKVS